MSKICFIDPSFTYQNPSTNSLIGFVEDLLESGHDVEIWSCDLEPALAGRVVHVKIPRISAPWWVKPFVDFVLIHGLAAGRGLMARPRADHTVVTGFLYLPADFATVHFSHFEWFLQLRRAKQHATQGVVFEFLKSIPGYFTEILLYFNPWRTHLLPVSEAVADDIRRWAAPWKTVSVLPNMVRADRFDFRMRDKWRADARRELGIAGDETILAFCSTGHFFRKGFAEAAATVKLLRAEGRQVRLLVIGGRERTLARQRRSFEKAHGELGDAAIFTGTVDNSQYYLACADAFFFPSRCEAFSLVEIEAAALGLPLFLTPHHGSEMILKDGVNGHWLPWDPPGMAKVLAAQIDAGLAPLARPDTGRALSRENYRLAWENLLEQPGAGGDKDLTA